MVALVALARGSWIAVVLVVLAAAVVGQRQFGTHFTPAGQPSLVHLDPASLESLRAEFNRAADCVRVVVLLSPT
jgi:hypothetical protein